MARITVHSTGALPGTDIQKIRYIMRKARDRDTALANVFSERFVKREGDDIFLDKGKRRYTVHFECGGDLRGDGD